MAIAQWVGWGFSQINILLGIIKRKCHAFSIRLGMGKGRVLTLFYYHSMAFLAHLSLYLFIYVIESESDNSRIFFSFNNYWTPYNKQDVKLPKTE